MALEYGRIHRGRPEREPRDQRYGSHAGPGSMTAAELAVLSRYAGIDLEPDRAVELLPAFDAMLERVRQSGMVADRDRTPAHVAGSAARLETESR
jgi:hypothetical protein